MNPMLEVIPTEKLPFSEALGFGAEMIGIGIVAVFAVLGIIWATLSVFKYVFYKNNSSERPVMPTVQEPVASAPVYTSQNEEILAVIAAAIAMAESECDDGTKFRVVSFRRK